MNIGVPNEYNSNADESLDIVSTYFSGNGYAIGNQDLEKFVKQTLCHIAILKKEIEKLKKNGIVCKSCHQLYHLKQ